MLVPLQWLGEWIDLPPVDEVVDRFTMGGLEVDSIERTGADLSLFRVGHVVERNAHPNADRLSVCQVDLGDGDPVQIVCGAPNVGAGQKVAVISPGAKLPDGTKIKKSKIRGEVSHGMICSESELGIGDGHEGILVLGDDAVVGEPLDAVMSAGDTVLEVAITANRGDCASMIGMAREVRAHFGGELRTPETAPSESGRAASEDIRVAIDDPGGCFRYVARVVRDIKVGSSPDWLQAKLTAAGLRPINNIVDVTNLVMLEFGQPLHAFDLDRIGGGEIRVREAAAGEPLRTLDDQDRKLEAGDLVIADASVPVALAGVMGGAESEVTGATVNLLIESAHFDPSRVRRTARRLGLHSDASYRFERGIDRQGVARAADRAARLIAELAGGSVSSGCVDAVGGAVEAAEEVGLDPARLNRLLGSSFSADEVQALLARVDIASEADSAGSLRCRVPSYRNDIALPQDLIEEAARIYGYDHLPVTVQEGPLVQGVVPVAWSLGDRVRDALCAEGLVETVNFPFVPADDADRLRLDEDDHRRPTVAVVNPISEEESRLRSTLAGTLLRRVRENRNRQVDVVRCFEVSRVFHPAAKPEELPLEVQWLGAALTRGDNHSLWDARQAPPLFYEIKGIATRLLSGLGHVMETTQGSLQPYLHPGASCGVVVGKRRVGWMGELHPAIAAKFDIDVPCALLELDLSALGARPTEIHKYREVSRHPSVQRDLAVLVDAAQPAGELLEAIRKQAGGHLLSVDVFDRYEGKGVAPGKVSLAFRLVFQRTDRTLTDAEVTKSIDRVVQMLAHRFGGELR